MNKIILCTLSPISQRTAEENLGIGYLAKELRKNNYDVIIVDAWLSNITDNNILNLLKKTNNIFAISFLAI